MSYQPIGSGSSPSGAANGDLAGTYPSPVVAKVNGVAVTGTPSTGRVITATSSSAATWQTPGTASSDFVNVLSSGVVGDGVTNDTAAINACITANPGKVIFFPAGRTYQISQTSDTDTAGGIKLNQPGTTLWLHGATIRLNVNTFTHYQMIYVTAADCKVLGGKLIGDVVAHTGTTGEWGYGISVGGGGDRFTADSVYATLCWGDGFFIWQRPSDVSFINCIGDNNRRQGCSIIDAIRPRITGGAYINNGVTKFTGPGGGIDIEPDPGSSRDVLDAVITGVTLTGNVGPGLRTSSNARTLTATITGCRASGNGATGADSGFDVVGANNLTTLVGCDSTGNSQDGFATASDVTSVNIHACTATANLRYGIINSGTASIITGGSASDNSQSGLLLYANSAHVTGLVASGNCTSGSINNVQIDINSSGNSLTGCESIGGTNATKPNYGYAVRSGATGARLIGCNASGTFLSGNFIDQTAGGTAVTVPVPGVAKPANPGIASGTDAAVINATIAALRTLGLIT